MARSKNQYEEKIEAVLSYLRENASQPEVAKRFHIATSTLQVWIRKHTSEGAETLKERRKNRTYSAELKHRAVEDYLSKKRKPRSNM